MNFLKKLFKGSPKKYYACPNCGGEMFKKTFDALTTLSGGVENDFCFCSSIDCKFYGVMRYLGFSSASEEKMFNNYKVKVRKPSVSRGGKDD